VVALEPVDGFFQIRVLGSARASSLSLTVFLFWRFYYTEGPRALARTLTRGGVGGSEMMRGVTPTRRWLKRRILGK
jgi:hypothetical protein